MRITFKGVRGSIPRPLTPNEIVQRIASKCKGKSITINQLKKMAPTGELGYGGNTSCILVEHKKENLIIDAGSGLRSLSARFLKEKGPIRLLLTHLHWDHIQGLPFFGPFYIPGREIHIYSALPTKNIKEAMRGQKKAPYFPVDYKLLPSKITFHKLSTDSVSKIGSFKIRSLKMHHPQLTYSYRIDAGNKSYAHISDTELNLLDQKAFARYRKFYKGCHAVAVDTQWNFQESMQFETWGHSSMHHFIELFADAKIGKMFYFHYNPQTDEAHIDETIQQGLEHLKLIQPKGKLKLSPAIEGIPYTI